MFVRKMKLGVLALVASVLVISSSSAAFAGSLI